MKFFIHKRVLKHQDKIYKLLWWWDAADDFWIGGDCWTERTSYIQIMITQLVHINGIEWQENITKAKNGNKFKQCPIYIYDLTNLDRIVVLLNRGLLQKSYQLIASIKSIFSIAQNFWFQMAN